MKTGFAFIILLLLACSCENILDQEPRDQFSEKLVWTDISLADDYLKGCYRNLNILQGWNSLINIDGLTDDIYFMHIFGTDLFLQGNITAANQGPFGDEFFSHINWSLYDNINAINFFLVKVDELVASTAETDVDVKTRADILKGEALFLRAYCYSKLATTYGGVPLITAPLQLDDDYAAIERNTFEETINFIASECDMASSYLLPKDETEMGRATKAAALSLKSRILLFAASDLTADGTVTNPLIGYVAPDRAHLWKQAQDAAKAVIDLGTHRLADMGGPEKMEIATNYYSLFKQSDLSNPEIIWGKMFRPDVGDTRQTNLHNGPNGNGNWGSNNPTQELVDAYRMEDGSDFFDHFKIDQNGDYINISTKYTSANPYDNREARFYGSILFDGTKWQSRFSNLQERDPVGIYDRRTRIYMENGKGVQTIPGIDTRQGPVTPEDGSYTGYLMKKTLDDETIGRDEHNDNIWIAFRFAEILLNYAEASLELGQTDEAAKYVNIIRNRSGLPDSQEDIEEALKRERRIELVFEEHRWYDLRRWKELTSISDAHGISITERIDRATGSSQTTWKRINAQQRAITDEKLYWIPIPFDEISRAPQLEQNPGY